MTNLNQFFTANIVLILSALSFVFLALMAWVLLLSLRLSRFEKRNEELFTGNKVTNVEELLISQAKNLKILDKDIQELYNISNTINKLAFRGFHKIGLVRFNPFKDVGGDQSFAIAILNGKNNGITISSLYSRAGTRFYSKSIVEGKSEKHPLTDEEKKAIEMAIEPKPNNDQ